MAVVELTLLRQKDATEHSLVRMINFWCQRWHDWDSVDRLDGVVRALQGTMTLIIDHDGGNDFKTPHSGKPRATNKTQTPSFIPSPKPNQPTSRSWNLSEALARRNADGLSTKVVKRRTTFSSSSSSSSAPTKTESWNDQLATVYRELSAASGEWTSSGSEIEVEVEEEAEYESYECESVAETESEHAQDDDQVIVSKRGRAVTPWSKWHDV